MTTWRFAARVLVMVLVLGACSPTYNWRELRLEGAPLLALLPCKPESAERQVPLTHPDAAPTTLHMRSCEAGGQTFALAWARLTDITLAPAAVASWRAASLQSLRVPASQAVNADWPVSVAGATMVVGVQAAGFDHRGQPVQSRTVYFVRGNHVFQAAMYGQQLPEDAQDAFFGGLQLQAP